MCHFVCPLQAFCYVRPSTNPNTREHRSWRQNKTAPTKWTQRSLRSLMRQFGHSHVSLLKIDIEGDEWPLLLPQRLAVLQRHVRQLVLEAHLAAEPYRRLRRLQGLDRAGFALFTVARNSISKTDASLRNACFELSYLNLRYRPPANHGGIYSE